MGHVALLEINATPLVLSTEAQRYRPLCASVRCYCFLEAWKERMDTAADRHRLVHKFGKFWVSFAVFLGLLAYKKELSTFQRS